MPDAFPIILCGGQSSRFGRDKLREPMPDGSWLIDRPTSILRAVFGPRVALVGRCDPAIASRADLTIDDPYPNVGPAGGILAALESCRGDVFVLAGDLPAITTHDIHEILAAAAAHPAAAAILAATPRPEPCIALYRRTAIKHLRASISGTIPSRLQDAIPPDLRILTSIDPARARNANTPAELHDALRSAPVTHSALKQ